MYDKDSVEKIGYITAKIEEVHAILQHHINDENEAFDKFTKRLDALEDDHKKWKTIYWVLKGILIFLAGVLAIEWTNIGKILRRIIGWE